MSDPQKKKKGKPSPFDDRLRDTETILWTSGLPELSVWEEIKTSGLFVVLGFCLVLAAFFILGAFPITRDLVGLLETSIDIIILIAIPMAVILRWIVKRRRSRMPERIYAVTNERLLYRLKDDVTTIRLEKLEEVNWSPGDVGGILQFGPDFPRWIEIREPQYVKELIEKARLERLEELKHDR